jgi:hypothetical protein
MKNYLLLFTMGLVMAIMAVTGCQEATITGIEGDALEEAGGLEPQSRVFVGRDSFGVALNAKISGTVEPSDPDCWLLTGSGQVTHLGQTTVTEHTACIDGTVDPHSINGTFTYEGQTGGMMEGSYEGTLENGVLQADVTIEAVDVQAVKEDPEETPPGGGTLTGTLTETEFHYTIEGWLFQRVREPVSKEETR